MYNIKSVSKLLEMPAVTIRAWERRYQVVTPTRSESGHRLYTDQDIEDLRWLKVQTEERGINISQAVKMLEKMREERRALPGSEERLQAASPAPMRLQNLEELRNDLHRALLLLDANRANAVLDLGFSMLHFEEMFHKVIAPTLCRIGDEWERDEVTVAQEHFASSLLSQRFAPFFRVFPVDPALPKVLAYCPSQEEHQIGLLLFALFLRKHGLEVIHLGANTPQLGVREIIRDHGVQIIAVSMTDPGRCEDTERMLNELSEEFPQLKTVLGGQGFARVSAKWRPFVLDGNVESWESWYAAEVKAMKRG